MKKTILLTIALAFATASGFAQKFGYCNTTQILSLIPEVKAADSDLKAFQTQLNKRGQEMLKQLQDSAAELDRKKENGLISPKDYDAQTATLQEEQAKLEAYQQDVYRQLAEKRQKLYNPILERVNQAMKDVANEQGFTMVFDQASSILIYADESLDVTPLVKAKLAH